MVPDSHACHGHWKLPRWSFQYYVRLLPVVRLKRNQRRPITRTQGSTSSQLKHPMSLAATLPPPPQDKESEIDSGGLVADYAGRNSRLCFHGCSHYASDFAQLCSWEPRKSNTSQARNIWHCMSRVHAAFSYRNNRLSAHTEDQKGGSYCWKQVR